MTASLKKTLKTVLPIAFGLFLVWYSYNSTSAEDRKQIIFYIKEADLFWVGISLIMGVLSHVSRAIRWNYLLEPLGYKPKIINNILIILTSYFANLGIPRSGEILRATALTTYEDVPFEKGFGTIVTERVIDLIMLLLIIVVTFFLQTDIIIEFFKNKGFNLTKIFILLGGAGVAALAFFYFIKKSTHPFLVKIKDFVTGLLQGVTSIFKMKNKWPFIFHTLFIWSVYIGMFWVIKFTVPETIDLSISQLLVAFIFGAFAMTATNGGIGLYPIVVSSALAIFGISSVSGDAFGWIMWISQTLLVVVFGAISFLLLPLLKRTK
ncbi:MULTISPECIES: lysylphosphatidylglycerol synthase transmembrane domain-containing protein [unclassified Cellulophaga]|uniref:lysylphosphatidylglycerol synthase transmembrane domain-containing protein n=1 Tax=unclassified Cellulophaga TaxID=2634405 RepID=UPI0026E1C22C|nr:MULTISPECIES: lysylphosphatidylglycerol synthase transmembrane domain-containing protein [unclassified Cellulophaga]MDO6491096.1 lysylphosphatidylglycerol synthase transmembrane domain-containing protein [Cellulophaga sp. 2_MG-2023]MDO6495371.1 lysylphosphatidylglycerol synthase transmembrane domain-containing protein [Cellulophaga sp. 3_MG-2023]